MEDTSGNQPDGMSSMRYCTFAGMIAAGTIVMFGLMYLNTNALDHVFFSETRAYMALIMGAVMAVVMLGFMWSTCPNKRPTSPFSSVVRSLSRFRCGWCSARRRSTTCRTYAR